MGQTIRLTASDGHVLDAYRAEPAGKPKGGLVVMQEAFGVNEHIRAVCDDFAARGYAALAPALYDRQRRNVEFGYGGEEAQAARALRAGLSDDAVLRDVAAAVAALRPFGGVGVVGYCVGGSAAWLAAARLTIDAAACYYPSDIGRQTAERPRCPVIVHFAERDHIINPDDRARLAAAHPDLPVFLYPAAHGFNNWHRPRSYDAASARLATERTLALFARHVAG
ncbi:MAG: dienelactone hydrolase family protein [Hyphomicrobiales bacterium]|nr:dienelactone hydrolase family protein [Hyphomicrobiales bacterium]